MSEFSSDSTVILHDELANFKDDSDEETDFESHQTLLREKIAALQITLSTLKTQLEKETELWRREIEEIREIDEKLEIPCDQCGKTSREILENQACVYQQAILRAQEAKKAKMQREIAITSYKTQLLQVENMCNLELTRMKQSKQSLQPLQIIASEWNKGDFAKPTDCQLKNKNSAILIEKSVSELKTELDQMLSEIGEKFAAVPLHLINTNQN